MEISIQTAELSDLHDLAVALLSASQQDQLFRAIVGRPTASSDMLEQYDENLAYTEANIGQWFCKPKIFGSKAVNTHNGLLVGLCL